MLIKYNGVAKHVDDHIWSGCCMDAWCALWNNKKIGLDVVIVGYIETPFSFVERGSVSIVFECNKCFEKYWTHIHHFPHLINLLPEYLRERVENEKLRPRI